MNEQEYDVLFNAALREGPAARYQRLCEMHTTLLAPQLAVLRAITAEGAERLVPDGRKVKQVVGHLLEWERYIVLSMGEIIAGVRKPAFLTRSRFVQPDGTSHDWEKIDAFNAITVEHYGAAPWADTQTRALYIAQALHRLMTQSGMITPELLEGTHVVPWARLEDGTPLPVGCGWFLWQIPMQHYTVEHAAHLNIGCG